MNVTIISNYGVKALSLSNDNVDVSNLLIILDISETVEILGLRKE